MPLPFSRKQSIDRVKTGVKRFLDTLSGESRHPIPEALTSKSKSPARPSAPPQDDLEGLPEDILADTRATEAARQAENAAIEQWRQQLAAALKDREERQTYFQDLARERENRFQSMLQGARDQLAGKAPALAGPLEAPPSAAAPLEAQAPAAPVDYSGYRVPPIELLEEADLESATFISSEELEAQEKALQETFDNFAVDAFVYDAVVGPRVTQFRVKPGMGVRVETIGALQKNISLSLANANIRIQAPIPGEPFVGVEVGNGNKVPIRLRSVLESKAWQQGNESIPLAMGVDIQGKIVLTDLAKAPHLLIAGATGSGKSVCMSNLILSLIFRFRPDELELALIDPKRVEFGLFKDIPHLIHPVVGDPDRAVALLKWVVKEMENRYEILAEKQARNLAGYNAKAEAQGFKKMPYLVVIIDELADLMMTSKGEAETSLARIAQLSRAVGIHTIIATQRPSVNVITGVIKANYPTRIAFQVSSNVDSRTILDCKGAESLLGQGDMLFNPPGIARLLRIQSPFVQDEEISRIVEHVSKDAPQNLRVSPDELEAPANKEGSGFGNLENAEDAALLKEAVRIVAETQKASTSYLQRRLRIGYNRAATLIEELEDRLYIGPQNGSTPREVFVTLEDIDR